MRRAYIFCGRMGSVGDDQTFYVMQAEVDATHDPRWGPTRPRHPVMALPYEQRNIGLPEWEILHAGKPSADNMHLTGIPYRAINIAGMARIVLAAVQPAQPPVPGAVVHLLLVVGPVAEVGVPTVSAGNSRHESPLVSESRLLQLTTIVPMSNTTHHLIRAEKSAF